MATNSSNKINIFITGNIQQTESCKKYNKTNDDKGYFKFSVSARVFNIKFGCISKFETEYNKKFRSDVKKCDSSDFRGLGKLSYPGTNAATTSNLISINASVDDYFQKIFVILYMDLQNDDTVCLNKFLDYPINKHIQHRFGNVQVIGDCFVNLTVDYFVMCVNENSDKNCLYPCETNERRTCNKGSVDQDNSEVCKKGWATIPYNVTIYPQKKGECNDKPVQETRYRCEVINKCETVTGAHECRPSWICAPYGNDTSVCIFYQITYNGSQHTHMTNFSGRSVLPKETISINVTYEVLPEKRLRFFEFKWLHDNSSSDITSAEERVLKNKRLTINDKMLTINTDCIGHDYSIYVFVRLTREIFRYHKIVFIIIKPPSYSNISNKFYVQNSETFRILTDGWPYSFMTLTVKREDNLEQFKLSMPGAEIFGHWIDVIFNLETWVYYESDNGIFVNKKLESRHATRAYETFYWNNTEKNMTHDDTLQCVFTNTNQADKMIIHLFMGVTSFNSFIGDTLSLKDFTGGEYLIVCLVFVRALNKTLKRYKEFTIVEWPRTACILPFGPATGLTIKCYCHSYPAFQTNYTMHLIDITTNNSVSFRRSKYLQIPYDILFDDVFRIYCRCVTSEGDKIFNLSSFFDFNISRERIIPVLNYNKTCMEHGYMPDEYNALLHDVSDPYKATLYNPLFFVRYEVFEHIPKLSLVYAIFMIIFVPLGSVGTVVVYIFVTKRGKTDEMTQKWNDKMVKKNMMRRMNDKNRHMYSTETDRMHEYFAALDRKHFPGEDACAFLTDDEIMRVEEMEGGSKKKRM